MVLASCCKRFSQFVIALLLATNGAGQALAMPMLDSYSGYSGYSGYAKDNGEAYAEGDRSFHAASSDSVVTSPDDTLNSPYMAVEGEPEVLPESALPAVGAADRIPPQFLQLLEGFRRPRDGRPRTTGNGSSRDSLRCYASEPPIRSLLPADRYGLSLDARPFIYVDVSGTSARQVLLSIRSEDGSDYRQVFLPIPPSVGTVAQDPRHKGEDSGVVGFRLPEDAPALLPNQTYQWSLSVICGDYFTLNDPTLMGWVRYVEPTSQVESVLQTKTPQAQLEWLSENGYWYDLTARILSMTTELAETPN